MNVVIEGVLAGGLVGALATIGGAAITAQFAGKRQSEQLEHATEQQRIGRVHERTLDARADLRLAMDAVLDVALRAIMAIAKIRAVRTDAVAMRKEMEGFFVQYETLGLELAQLGYRVAGHSETLDRVLGMQRRVYEAAMAVGQGNMTDDEFEQLRDGLYLEFNAICREFKPLLETYSNELQQQPEGSAA